jgi:tetratricopeptide (TPR) repeat protein
MGNARRQLADHWFNRGCEELKHNRYQKAAQSFTKALRTQPGWHEALQRRALVRHFQKRPDLAIRDYRKALEDAPRCAYCWEGLADAQSALGKHLPAITSWNRALSLRPRELWWHYDRGNAYLACGRPLEAIRDFRKASRWKGWNLEWLCAKGIKEAQLLLARMPSNRRGKPLSPNPRG